MSNIPVVTGKQIIVALKKAGFIVVRIKGSHHFLKHSDGRCTVVPIHSNESIGIGLFSKILKDCEFTKANFNKILK